MSGLSRQLCVGMTQHVVTIDIIGEDRKNDDVDTSASQSLLGGSDGAEKRPLVVRVVSRR